MNRERWIGLAVVLVVIGGIIWWRSEKANKPAEPTKEAVEAEVEGFARELGVVLPEDVEKTSLTDVTGGEATGIATRKVIEGRFTHTVLAALPDPQVGTWYEAWLVKLEPLDVVYTGKLTMGKGGWVLDYISRDDLTDHPQVVVTLERVDDRKPEQHILEGSF